MGVDVEQAPHRWDRARVVDAADRVFTAEGAVGLDHAAIATLAGADQATVRALFPERIDVVVAVLEHRHERWNDGLAAAAVGAADARDEILTVFAHLESCFEDESWTGCAFINGYGELGRSESRVAALAHEHLRGIEAHLHALAGRAGLPLHVADALSLLVEGAKVEAAIHRTTRPARSARLAAATLMTAYAPNAHTDFI
ncbi:MULTISPECIES: TetR/AcrR family transcriptional regulator [unclassified Curtobacterium]|uniref:TetR/AcrR family transcriptional regulator n=1 Tax=unclassified Curtobacterium TaxID=257496 RepID=UPI000D92C5D6|nr:MULTISPECIES: TetR/AcrR family transcriptional regulator [unclassified Curtobacterium]PYY33014.1 TetR/AcrR family transcriptional regulator [Curtobacterium sp. MCBD17_030]PZE34739.1 TetR/AcrR family transcriptional regulator [Curtobacterium sp. MCPF17_031]PZF13814.1 TetR/AcrR family transcriptional regulator [Curtobacterium sp. MCPF17_011]